MKGEVRWGGYQKVQIELRSIPAAFIASMSSFFLGTLLMSILMSVRESLLKFIWDLTISGASTKACMW